jgi:hypothetical protein
MYYPRGYSNLVPPFSFCSFNRNIYFANGVQFHPVSLGWPFPAINIWPWAGWVRIRTGVRSPVASPYAPLLTHPVYRAAFSNVLGSQS